MHSDGMWAIQLQLEIGLKRAGCLGRPNERLRMAGQGSPESQDMQVTLTDSGEARSNVTKQTPHTPGTTLLISETTNDRQIAWPTITRTLIHSLTLKIRCAIKRPVKRSLEPACACIR